MRKSVLFTYLVLLTFCGISTARAQPGKNGSKTIIAANVVVNEYTSLSADAATGSAFIKVTNSALNTNNRFANPLSAGDLIMIIQVQGATINGAPNDSTWGAITNYNNCGLYEFSEVAGVPDAATINLYCSLKNSYTASGKVEIVRIPRYTSLTINSGDSLTCDAWNGATGGVVAVEVDSNTVINTGGAINVSANGFRGGALFNVPDVIFGLVAPFRAMNADSGAMKGESIAGYQTDYNVYGGMYCRGAPANGGGGGNDHNSAGGGGANAGAINNWTGNGNPDLSNAAWAAAWNLEYSGFANATSSGGGRGGYAASASSLNPYTIAPGNANWGYDSRDNVGGKGGRPLDYSGGRIFFGGGGGAGHENNGVGGIGANGGGLVYILSYGQVTGGGIIAANGAHGGSTPSSYGNDGAGGAGGGGTAIVSSTGSISGISIYANGGDGGNQTIASSEAEGPGGGGGGGYIATSNGTIACQANGGANGTTNSTSMTTFLPNGATKGGNGLPNEIINVVPFSTVIAHVGYGVSICPGQTAALSASGGATYLWSPNTGLSCDTCSITAANPDSTTTYVVTVSDGSCSGTDSVVITVFNNAQAGTITASSDSICPGVSVNLVLTGSSGQLQWQYSFSGNSYTVIPGADSTSYSTQPGQTTYFRVLADSASCKDTSITFVLTVNPLPPPPTLSANDSVFCSPDSALITTSGNYFSYRWNNGDSTNSIYAHSTGEYWLTVSDANNCSATSGQLGITVYPVPVAPLLSAKDSIFCLSDSTLITTSGSYSSYDWNNHASTSYTYATRAGDYWVTVTDNHGCSVVSGHLLVSVYPVPSVAIVVQGDTISSRNADSYQWYYDDSLIAGATSPVYIAPKTGDYAVQITDSNGCKTISNYTHVVATGIISLFGNSPLDIYPDPFTNELFIANMDAADKLKSIVIYDLMGRKVLNNNEIQGSSNREVIDVSFLSVGMYYVNVTSEKGNYTQPVLKR